MNHPDACKPHLFLPIIANPLTPNRRYLHCPATGQFYCLATGSLYQVTTPIIPLSTNMQLLLQKRDIFFTVQPGLFSQPEINHNTKQLNKTQKSKPNSSNYEPPLQNNDPLPPATEDNKISLNKHESNLNHEINQSAQGNSTSFTDPLSHNSLVNGEKKEEVNLKSNKSCPPIQSKHLTTLANQEKLPHIKSDMHLAREINVSVNASSTSSTCTQSKGAQTKKKKNKASKPKKKSNKSKVPSLKTSSINSMKSSAPCKQDKLSVSFKKNCPVDDKTISSLFLNVKKNSTTSTTMSRHRTCYPYNPCVNPKKKSYIYYVSTLPTKTQQIQSLNIELSLIRGKPLFNLKKGPHVPSPSAEDESDESTDELDPYFGSYYDTRLAVTSNDKHKHKKERNWQLQFLPKKNPK